MAKKVLAAFDQGEIPIIVCINASTVPFAQWKCGPTFSGFVWLMQKYADIFAKTWRGLECRLVVGTKMQPGAWAAIFTDTATVANALGYHDTTPDGMPLMHNFVKTTLEDGELPSVTASHELIEALADPCINLTAEGPWNGRIVSYAYETADAVERSTFPIAGVQFSNFVFPAWFENFKRARYDYLSECKRPFQIMPGGYMPVKINGQWTQIFAKGAKKHTPRRSALRGKKLKPSKKGL